MQVIYPALPSSEQIAAVKAYIKQSWRTLSRSVADIIAATRDSKIDSDDALLLYISPQENRVKIEESLQLVGAEELNSIKIRTLPADVSAIEQHGLLYLPGAYVVPGGRFNEMFGWDSYFILLGLLRDGELTLAQSLVEQFVYEIEHYGTILNANRTYFLTRSQPPVFSLMVLALFQYTQDRQWLNSLLPAITSYYDFWVKPPHLHPETGLSRFYDVGEGAAPEAVEDEKDAAGKNHYERILEVFKTQKIDKRSLNLFYDQQRDRLTDFFYKGDRSMRESGFDCSHRFGLFNAEVTHYLPVCLNALLYQMEQDIVQIYTILGKKEVEKWRDRAQQRCQLINQLLWDETAGFYFDYNFDTQQRRAYEFATTFYPLWTGIASPKQAEKVVLNLPKFAAPGGLRTSTYVTGNQWDAPFGWAPLQLIATVGLCRYGYYQEAVEIARNFISLVVQEFEKNGTIVEKYDVCDRSSNVADKISSGYSSNEIGFGWTNGVILELLAFLEQHNAST